MPQHHQFYHLADYVPSCHSSASIVFLVFLVVCAGGRFLGLDWFLGMGMGMKRSGDQVIGKLEDRKGFLAWDSESGGRGSGTDEGWKARMGWAPMGAPL